MTAGSSQEDLPENHPPPEVMERLQLSLQQAEAEPENAEVRVSLGNQFYDIGRFDAAIQWYEEALALGASSVMLTTDLGTCYLYTGNLDKALELYRTSLETEPGHPQTMQNMGIAVFTAGKYTEAIEIWEKLLELQPDYVHRADVEQQIETAKVHLNAEQPGQ